MKRILLSLLLICWGLPSPAQSLQPGLDPSFGKLGRVTDIVDSGVRYRDVTGIAIQPDGKIITTGQFILRLHPDGRLDSSFGGTGLIKPSSLTYPEVSYAKGVLLQPDGKIVISGTVYNPRMNNDTAIVIRLLKNGSADSSFGKNGVAKLVGVNKWGWTMSIAGNADCAVLQEDGKILIAGSFIDSRPYAIVARVNSDGSIDSSFGGKGYSAFIIGNYRGAVIGHGLGVLPDSRIVLGGYGADSSDKSAQFLMRLMPDGSPDTSLGHTGQRFPFRASYLREVIVQPDGKTLMCIQGFDRTQALVRFTVSGDIDKRFGDDGFCNLPSTLDVATGLLMSDGRLLFAGAQDSDYAIIRVLPDGKGIDSSFGTNGVIHTDQSNYGYEGLTAIALQRDGKIIAGGQGRVGGWSSWAASIIRYKANAFVSVPETVPAPRGLVLHPNPANNLVSIAGIPQSEFRRLEVYTMNGRLLISQQNRPAFSVATLPEGLYLVKIRTNNDDTHAIMLSVKH